MTLPPPFEIDQDFIDYNKFRYYEIFVPKTTTTKSTPYSKPVKSRSISSDDGESMCINPVYSFGKIVALDDGNCNSQNYHCEVLSSKDMIVCTRG